MVSELTASAMTAVNRSEPRGPRTGTSLESNAVKKPCSVSNLLESRATRKLSSIYLALRCDS